MIRSENRKAIQVFKLQTSIVMLPVVSKSLLVWSNDSTAKVSVRFGLKDFPRKVCFLDQDMCFTARILRRFRSLKDLIHFKSLLFRLKVYTRKVFLSIERFHSKSPRFRLKEFTQKYSFSLKRFRSKRLRFHTLIRMTGTRKCKETFLLPNGNAFNSTWGICFCSVYAVAVMIRQNQL